MKAEMPRLEKNDPPDRKNRIQVGAGFSFNYGLRTRSKTAPLPPDPSAGPNVDRNYDDGYVRVDSSGNAGGKTWYWGYNNASQYDPSGDGSITMHYFSASPAGDRGTKTGDDPHVGPDIAYFRDVGQAGIGRWGIALGLRYIPLHMEARQSFSGVSLTRLEDTFTLDGSIAPNAPYRGSFRGPGVLLDATPINRVMSVVPDASLRRQFELDSNFFDSRIGPYWEYITHHVSFVASGGLAVAVADAEFRSEEVVTESGTSMRRKESNRQGEVIVGPQVEVRVSLLIRNHLSLFIAGQYEHLGSLTFATPHQTAVLDLSDGYGFITGLGYSF